MTALASPAIDRPIALQRSRGTARIRVAAPAGASRLDRLYQDGCAKIRLPRTHAGHVEAVLVNTAGGLTGGDVLRWSVEAASGATLVATTPACERIYRSTGDTAEMGVDLTAGPGARLDWLPQETILFEGSRLSRRIEADLAADARLLALEAVLLGREAMGEDPRDILFRDDWRVRRAGRLVHAEATRLAGSPLERDGLSLLAGMRAFATLLYVGPDAGRRRAALPERPAGAIGISFDDERLVVRLLAPSGLALRRLLGPMIAALAGAGTLPRLWHI